MSLSRHNPSLTLEKLRFDPETQYLERKGRRTRATKVADELIGMLNAGGGTLVFGIDDDGTVEDLQSTDLLPGQAVDLDQYRKIVHDLIEPPAKIELEEVFLETGELVFIYHVDQDVERLFQRQQNESVFLRVADSNKGPLTRDEVKNLEYNKPIRSFEQELRQDFDPGDFDRDLCEEYRKSMEYAGTFPELAIKRNLAAEEREKVVFRNAAVLLFAEDPEKYIPNASARYVRYEGDRQKSGGEFNVIKDVRFEANIPTLIRRLEGFIEGSLRDYYFLDVERGRFVRVPEIPKEAWLEGIVNALGHRSYNMQGNPILIRHFDDRIEISNSGPLPAQVTVENIEHQRFSRNPLITRTLLELGYVRELNEGVPRIYRAMKESFLARPEYSDVDTTVTLTLRNKVTPHKETILGEVLQRIEQSWSNLNKTQTRIVQLLFNIQEATLYEMRDALGVTEQTMRNNLKSLEEMGIVRRCSEKRRDKNAKYRFPER